MNCTRKSVSINYPEGGYSYPPATKHMDENDCSIPFINLHKTKDSFDLCYYGYYWRKAYNEPNLFVKPMGQDMFRLIYEAAMGESAVFTLTQNELVVKQVKNGYPYPSYDSTKLSELERRHYEFLKWNFPFQDKPPGSARKRKLDSLARQFPKLLEPAYYKYLLAKSDTLSRIPFEYSLRRFRVSTEKFKQIIGLINESGYWGFPYRLKCDGDFMDGYGFTLEANTSTKFNIVGLSCPGDKSKLTIACQEIINIAHLERKIKLL